MPDEKFVLPEGFTTAIEATAGYDYRDDPDDKRGCCGLELIFILRAPDGGGITWELLTGWMARPVREPGWSIFARRAPKRGTKPGLDIASTGMPQADLLAGPVDLHYPSKMHDWWLGPDDGCRVIAGGGVCWGDRGYMVGDRVLEALVTDGDAGVWRELLEIYRAWTDPERGGDHA